ncbi:hypothetical protein AGMMS50218_09150 [Actinomycetota bacterium]|nr:hypothetical protein AGMMS50218_09150 [Actinomycetota bacterium]
MRSHTTTQVHVLVRFDLGRQAVVEVRGVVGPPAVERLLGVVHRAQDISGRSVALDLCAATVAPEALDLVLAASTGPGAERGDFEVRWTREPADPLAGADQARAEAP